MSAARHTSPIVSGPGEGERLKSGNRVAFVKAELPHISFFEYVLDGDFEGPDLHSHDDQTDCFYVLEGEVQFTVEGETFTGGPGTFVAAPPGVVHAFSKPGPGRARLLNIHAPDAGFAEGLRRGS